MIESNRKTLPTIAWKLSKNPKFLTQGNIQPNAHQENLLESKIRNLLTRILLDPQIIDTIQKAEETNETVNIENDQGINQELAYLEKSIEELKLRYRLSIEDRIIEIKLKARTSIQDWMSQNSLEMIDEVSKKSSSQLDVNSEDEFSKVTFDIGDINTKISLLKVTQIFNDEEELLALYAIGLLCRYYRKSKSKPIQKEIVNIYLLSSVISLKIAYDVSNENLMSKLSKIMKLDINYIERLEIKFLETINYDLKVSKLALYKLLDRSC